MSDDEICRAVLLLVRSIRDEQSRKTRERVDVENAAVVELRELLGG